MHHYNNSEFMILRFIKTTAVLLAFQSIALAQQLKIATVDMEKLFNDYDRTNEVQKDVNIERAHIQKDNNKRLADIRQIDDEMQKIREELKSENVGAKKTKDLNAKASELQQDGIHKERERTEFLNRRNKALTEKMQKQMRSIIVEINQAVSERAKSDDYDYIFDKSGNTKQGTPFILFSKEMADLTEVVLKDMNANAAAKSGK